MTITQKILAAHAGVDKVEAGELIMVRTDLVLGNDITSPVAINEFEKYGFNKVFDKEKIALVMDHFAPTISLQTKILKLQSSANNVEILLISMILLIIMMWGIWVLSMLFYQKRGWLLLAKL